MKTDLRDYIKIYNVIDEQMCNETVKQLSIAEWTKHTYHNPTEEKFISYDDDLSVSNDRISNKMELMDKTWNCFRNYLNELDMEWYFSWQAHSEIRFNRYDVNTQMRIHCDHIHTLFDEGFISTIFFNDNIPSDSIKVSTKPFVSNSFTYETLEEKLDIKAKGESLFIGMPKENSFNENPKIYKQNKINI
jgi:hypothetical protein